MKDVLTGGSTYARLPPMWFAGLFIWLADGRTVGPGLVLWAALAVIAAAVVATLVSILPAELMRRRDLERRADVSTGPMMPMVRPSWRGRCAPPTCAHSTSSRSPAWSAAGGTPCTWAPTRAWPWRRRWSASPPSSIRGSLTLAAPHAALLALPLVWMFFAILGLRSACAIPVDLDANWPLRLRQPTVWAALNAMRLVLLTLAVLPPVALPRWRARGCGARAPPDWWRSGI